MTNKQYKTLAKQLEAAGYRKWLNDRNPSFVHNCNWYYSKTLRDEEGEALYQINWLVYDRGPYIDRDPCFKKHPWGVETTIYIFQAVELHLWERDYTIKEVEKAAEELFRFATKHKLNEEI